MNNYKRMTISDHFTVFQVYIYFSAVFPIVYTFVLPSVYTFVCNQNLLTVH